MGLFDLFRKNKNIITDNGLNKIYYDNGKGVIKEQFVKINGVVDGEFIAYERNGTFRKKHYKNGEICLTEEELLEKNRQEEINKVIQEQIDNLLVLDSLIVKIIHIPLLMQMDNPTIEIFTRWICNKWPNRFDEETIKFYLHTKRNLFIRDFILFGDTTILSDRYFTEIINSFPKKRLIPRRRFEWFNYTISEQILDKILIDKNSGLKLECGLSINAKGFSKGILSQDSVFFGLNYNAYLLIHKVLKNSEEGQAKYSQNKQMEEEIIESAEKEILLICNKNKLNQEELVLSLY